MPCIVVKTCVFAIRNAILDVMPGPLHTGPTKVCPSCKMDLPIDSFGRIPSRKNRLVPRCKSCAYAVQRQWRSTPHGKERVSAAGARQRKTEKYKAMRLGNRPVTPYHRRPEVREAEGIVLIPLTKGYSAIVDIEDAHLVISYRWQARIDKKEGSQRRHIYAKTKIPLPRGGTKTILMHQLIFGDLSEGREVDHRDNDGLNNRRDNLRSASRSQNLGNRRKQEAAASSIYKGVCFCKQTGRWAASITLHGKNRWLGRFSTEANAAQAYNFAAVDAFGDFAFLNRVLPHEGELAAAVP